MMRGDEHVRLEVEVHLSTLLDMVESGCADRAMLGTDGGAMTGSVLAQTARAGGVAVGHSAAVVYVGENHPYLPIALLAAAVAGVPYVPINYRLDDALLSELVRRYPGAVVLADGPSANRLAGLDLGSGDALLVPLPFDDWLAHLPLEAPPPEPRFDDDEVAVVLFTSGTTGAPKAALLRHRHLMAYLLETVEFAGAGEDEAVLVAVPPYHVAGVANVLSNLFAGRRLVFLRGFDPDAWLETVRTEGISNAMVVPTMLARIVDALDGRPADVPTLRTLAYGGAKVSERVLLAALEAFPDAGFVNAYGLTETASTIAVLGPDDHRAALTAPSGSVARQRLSSAGRVLPTVEVEVRDDLDRALPVGESGTVHLRGEQISGEYAGESVLDSAGWFCTRDRGRIDDEGYLFIEGRADDTIIRGGENIAPAEIEAVLLAHELVADACVVGVPDDEWGQRIEAAVVLRSGSTVAPEELQAAVRAELRSSKTPDRIVFRDSLPHTDTGKMLRRVVLDELVARTVDRHDVT
jgi:acyl-CoA synthetase (AMP-forming)/AMP-acid ligase II